MAALFLYTLRLRFTSPRVGIFPHFNASATGSPFPEEPRDILDNSSPKDMIGTTVLVPGTL